MIAFAHVTARLAATGLAAAGALRGLSRLPPSPTPQMRGRVVVLRDLFARVSALHGVVAAVDGAPPAGPALLVANHVSWLDPLVIAGLVPCVPIAKGEIATWPVVGRLGRSLGVLFVDRHDDRSRMRALRAAAHALEDGIAVLNFPEGTTTRGDRILPFHPGLFGLARRLGVSVVPVAIAYTDPAVAWVGEATFVPHYLRLAAAARIEAQVVFGSPIDPRAHAGAAELARAARDVVEAHFGGMRVAAVAG